MGFLDSIKKLFGKKEEQTTEQPQETPTEERTEEAPAEEQSTQ